MLSPLPRCAMTSRVLGYLAVVAILGLSFQSFEGFSTSAGIFRIGKMPAKASIQQHRDRLAIISVANWIYEISKPHPTFLRVHYKQNLLVWPVVSCDLARSPPSAALV